MLMTGGKGATRGQPAKPRWERWTAETAGDRAGLARRTERAAWIRGATVAGLHGRRPGRRRAAERSLVSGEAEQGWGSDTETERRNESLREIAIQFGLGPLLFD